MNKVGSLSNMKPVDGPLLPAPEVGQGHGDLSIPWFTMIGFFVLTFNSVLAIYGSIGDYTSIALVVFSYVDLFLLFYYLRWYERAPAETESGRRQRMKIAIWLLTTMLTVMFSYKVASVMPLPAAVLVWAMAGAAALGFYSFFVHQEEVGISGRSRALLPL